MTGRVGDLTTLVAVKGWRDPPVVGSADDTQLQREITACSTFFGQYLQRTLIAKSYVEYRNGIGQCEMMVRNRPLVSVSSVKIGQTAIPVLAVGDLTNSGFTFDSNPDPRQNSGLIWLRGYDFCWGKQNVALSYVAGLLVSGEKQTIPGVSTYNVPMASLQQLWAADFGVSYAGGAALVAVTGTPSAGQYVAPVGPDDPNGYVFAAADAGKAITISYSYTPRDLEAACIRTVILEYNRRKNTGSTNESLAGQSVGFYTAAALTKSAQLVLDTYKDVVPVLT